MKKVYLGELLVKNSRYKDFFKNMNMNMQKNIINRIEELIKENLKYCDKGNYNHLSNIFTSIAIYENLQKEYTKEKSFQITSQIMWNYVEKSSKNFRKISKIPYFLKIMRIILPYLFDKGSGYGWQYQWHKDKSTKNHLEFECTKCIYQQIFKKYNLEELGPMFCYSDDINYGNLDNILFIRKHTLCKDGENCDFKFIKKIKGEN